MSEYEEVVKVPEGMGPFEPEYVTVLTGRMRRPESVAEWQQQQAARLAQFKALPAGAAVIALLQAGEDFDAKAAGGQLDAWQRKCVLVELARLLAVASRDYPPAARLMRWVHGEWLRRYGAGELLRGDPGSPGTLVQLLAQFLVRARAGEPCENEPGIGCLLRGIRLVGRIHVASRHFGASCGTSRGHIHRARCRRALTDRVATGAPQFYRFPTKNSRLTALDTPLRCAKPTGRRGGAWSARAPGAGGRAGWAASWPPVRRASRGGAPARPGS